MTETNNGRNLVETTYEAPVVEVYEVAVERGFATSIEAYGYNEEQQW